MAMCSEFVFACALPFYQLNTAIHLHAYRLAALRKAGAANTRVVKGSTVHVNIPRLSAANTEEVPNIAELLQRIKE
jgi:hypothetical protein